MRKLLLLASFFMLFYSAVVAQDCKGFYYLQNNKQVEMTIYNKKGKPNGRQLISVSNVKSSGSGYTSTVNTEMFNEKGKTLAKAESAIECKGGVMMVDAKMFMPAAQQQQYAQTDAKADKIYIEYPANMKVGDALKDAVMNMTINNANMVSTVNMNISDRKIEAKESVTTTAGTWECFKISYKMKMHIKTMGIGIPSNFDGTEWFAPGFGVVKTESKYGGTAITAIK